jgi:hypothetical protein
MNKVQESLQLLGLKVKDKVTGKKGIVTTVGFDLYGCIQVAINPGLDEKGAQMECQWYDTNRVEVTDKKSVMTQPDFVTVPGPAEKPSYLRQ